MTKLIGKGIPFEVIYKGKDFILVGIEPFYQYADGKRTDQLAGYRYEVVETADFDKIKVKIKGQDKPIMTSERLQEIRESGEKVVVQFTKAVNTLYLNRTLNSVEDSFSADSIQLVENKPAIK